MSPVLRACCVLGSGLAVGETNRNRTGCLKEPFIQEESQCVSKSCSAVRSSGGSGGTERGIVQLGGPGRGETQAGLLEKAGY